MDRGAAHAAIVLTLYNHYRSQTATNSSFSDVADDILDAIWPPDNDFCCVGCGREGYIACPDCPYEVIAHALGWDTEKANASDSAQPP